MLLRHRHRARRCRRPDRGGDGRHRRARSVSVPAGSGQFRPPPDVNRDLRDRATVGMPRVAPRNAAAAPVGLVEDGIPEGKRYSGRSKSTFRSSGFRFKASVFVGFVNPENRPMPPSPILIRGGGFFLGSARRARAIPCTAHRRIVADRSAFSKMATSMMSARTAAPAVSFRAASRGACPLAHAPTLQHFRLRRGWSRGGDHVTAVGASRRDPKTPSRRYREHLRAPCHPRRQSGRRSAPPFPRPHQPFARARSAS